MFFVSRPHEKFFPQVLSLESESFLTELLSIAFPLCLPARLVRTRGSPRTSEAHANGLINRDPPRRAMATSLDRGTINSDAHGMYCGPICRYSEVLQ